MLVLLLKQILQAIRLHVLALVSNLRYSLTLRTLSGSIIGDVTKFFGNLKTFGPFFKTLNINLKKSI